MKLRNYITGLLALVVVAVACKKTDFDMTQTGEALADFRLQTPASNSELALNGATPNSTVVVTWTPSKPGLGTAPTYKWVAALSTGSIDAPLIEIPADNAGKDTKLTLTQKAIDDALKAKGIADGATASLIWSVVADNGDGNSKLRSSDVFNLKITRMNDGASPFVLLGPASSATTIEINPNSTTTSFTFNWTKSVPAKTASGMKYRVYFYKDDAAMTPLFSAAANNTGNDSLLTISHKDFSDSLTKYGYTNLAQPVNIKWKVAATSGGWTQWSDYTNQLSVLREVKMFIVGGSSPADWNPAAAIQMIPDSRFPGTFFAYVRLTTAGSGIKFLSENTDWSSPTLKVFGDANSSGTTGDLTSAGGGSNINVPADGVYRVTVDLTNNKYYLQTGGIGPLGMVGAFQGWSASGNSRMNNFAPNKSILLVNMTTNDEFKFHDGNDWDNSANNKNRWFGLDGTQLKIDGGSYGNVKWTGNSGRVRAIFDGSNVNILSYDLTEASEMRVVGDGMQGVNAWDPGTSPQMTYMGNGTWQITLNLIGGKDIKFVAGNAWGAFDYEDNGAGTAAGERKVKWTGGDNFKTPTASGTYTITLNEYTQTVTIL